MCLFRFSSGRPPSVVYIWATKSSGAIILCPLLFRQDKKRQTTGAPSFVVAFSQQHIKQKALPWHFWQLKVFLNEKRLSLSPSSSSPLLSVSSLSSPPMPATYYYYMFLFTVSSHTNIMLCFICFFSYHLCTPTTWGWGIFGQFCFGRTVGWEEGHGWEEVWGGFGQWRGRQLAHTA